MLKKPGMPVSVKLTVPYGMKLVVDADVSVTVAVHIRACPARTGLLQVRVVEVVRLVVTMVVDPVLAEWVPSP